MQRVAWAVVLGLGVGLVVVVGAAACGGAAHPDRTINDDGSASSAEVIPLVAGEATADGDVSFDGGDPVDWKSIALPKGQTGSLDVELRWTTPGGRKLALEVFDEWTLRCERPAGAIGHRADRLARSEMCATPHDPDSGRAEISAKTRSSETSSVGKAQGTYFVRVFAPRSGDAGEYQLVADFKPDPASLAVGSAAPVAKPVVVAADPVAPTKPGPTAVVPVTPPPVVACTTFDPANASCKPACPTGAPATWPGCKDKCVDPPDPTVKACQDTMPCPRGGDRRVKSCTLASFPACPDPKDPDPLNPKCDAKELVARVINISVGNSGPMLTVAAGTASTPLLGRTWTGYLLTDDGSRVAGGEVTIVRVDKTLTIVKSTLTLDQSRAGTSVKLIPPPRAPL